MTLEARVTCHWCGGSGICRECLGSGRVRFITIGESATDPCFEYDDCCFCDGRGICECQEEEEPF